jgi:hypothetical protein
MSLLMSYKARSSRLWQIVLNQSAKPHLNEVIVMVAIEAKKITIQL